MPENARTSSNRRPTRPLNTPVHVPVPPSLMQSPHLNSPQSIFRRSISGPRVPSEEDEQWLRDTVPLADRGQRDSSKGGGENRSPLSAVHNSGDADRNNLKGDGSGKGTSPTQRSPPKLGRLPISTAPPPLASPPLVRKWAPNGPPPNQQWADSKQRQDSPISPAQGYFLHR